MERKMKRSHMRYGGWGYYLLPCKNVFFSPCNASKGNEGATFGHFSNFELHKPSVFCENIPEMKKFLIQNFRFQIFDRSSRLQAAL